MAHEDRLPYLPGLDVMRAVAVLGVFLYHAGVPWLPGGFLGVDVFFVISGFLITSLLWEERARTGRIALGRFWRGRARRLLPAVGVMVAVTLVVAAVVVPRDVASLRADAVASLLYVANWHFIADHQSYFEQFARPSLFRHLWSLSVEEQFYLVWPPLLLVLARVLRRRWLVLLALLGAVASAVAMGVLFTPGHDLTRVYDGTDTRAVGLLVGVALGLTWRPWRLPRTGHGRWAPAVVDLVALAALGGLLAIFATQRDYAPALYRGGFTVVALLTALLLVALTHPAGTMGRWLATRPALWVGRRSYSLYLWHWPVLALTRPGIDVFWSRTALVPLQLAVALALAGLSYRFVEQPFRTGEWPRPWPKRTAISFPSARLAPLLAGAVLSTVVIVGWSGIVPRSGPGVGPPLAAASPRGIAIVREAPRVHPAPLPHPVAAHHRRRPKRHPRVVAFGDSVMAGAGPQLEAALGPRFSMNARVGRQADEFVALVRGLHGAGPMPDDLVIHMGNNGPLTGDQMAALHRASAGAGHLFLVDDHAPVSWVGQSNAALAAAAAHWPRTTLVHWNAEISPHPEELWDGIHLKPEAATRYARLIARAVRTDGA